MSYATKAATLQEIQSMRKSIPSPLGHTVTGYDSQFRPVIETCDEGRLRDDKAIEYVRRKMPNGKFIYRRIERLG